MSELEWKTEKLDGWVDRWVDGRKFEWIDI